MRWRDIGLDTRNASAGSFTVSYSYSDPRIAQQLRAAFFDDLRFAEQRNYEAWAHRSLWHKTIDGLAYLAHSQL